MNANFSRLVRVLATLLLIAAAALTTSAQSNGELCKQYLNEGYAELRAKAQTALRNLQPAGGGYKEDTFVSEVYAAPFYQQRFGNFIAPLVIRNGLVLESAHAVEAYASLRLTRDTRSSAGSAPQIYSDNFLVAGVGLRARPFKNNLTVYGEAGIAKN